MLEYVAKLSRRVAKHLRQPKEAGHAALTRLALDALYSCSIELARRLRAPASPWGGRFSRRYSGRREQALVLKKRHRGFVGVLSLRWAGPSRGSGRVFVGRNEGVGAS